MAFYILTEAAKDDLFDIWLDIHELTKNPEFANSFVDSFVSAFKKISKNPGIGESRKELFPNFRKWTHRKYMIYYSENKELVRIERILWGRSSQKIKLMKP